MNVCIKSEERKKGNKKKWKKRAVRRLAMNTFRWLDDSGAVGGPVGVYLTALFLFLSGSSIHVLHEMGGRRSLVGLPFFSFDEIGDECLKKKR